jgi:autophagy-related protein 13
VEEKRPPPLVIEIYLDLAELSSSQSLVIVDDDGKRWNVAETLNPSSAAGARPPKNMDRATRVTLERWEIRLDGSPSDSVMHPDKLSTVYKRGIPLFRSLFTYGRTLPSFKYTRRIARQPANQPALKLKYEINSGRFKTPRRDTLAVPFLPGDERVTEHYSFEPLQCSAGTLNCSVTYRTKCEFRVDDSESLLSSHFMGLDDHYFRPSLAGRQQEPVVVPSSVPNTRKDYAEDVREQGQAYGSLSTFHRTGHTLGSSPLSAMRAVRDDNSNSSVETPPQRIPPNHRSQGSRSSLRSEAGPSSVRRPSVSFQPFKAGSLASSPALNAPPSPSSSAGRAIYGVNPLAQARKRNSLTTLPQQALRTPSIPNETAVTSSASSSPKPAPINRYSSSFSHRRTRFSSTGSKGDDDQNSSGKQSASSSAQPDSGLLNEGQQGGSSGSMPQTDDDNLKDFIALLEQKKDLKSFNRDSEAVRDASMRKTTAALSKFRGMRDSNAVLSDSLSSSLLLHRSSSSSGRQLSSVPSMVHGTSVSTSSSPGKPISPHTPHTPAIPSRLSNNLAIDYNAEYTEPRRSRRSSRRRDIVETTREEDSSDTTSRGRGTTPMDIPTSPRAWPYPRRSNSVSQQQQRALEEEPDVYSIRSASLPTEDRTELSMSELLRMTEGTGAVPVGEDRSPGPESASLQAYPFPESRPESREESSRPSSMIDPVSSFRSRLTRGRRGSPSFSERGSRYSAGSRISAVGGEEDELIFQLSELGSASRRSIEDGRGSAIGGSGGERKRG